MAINGHSDSQCHSGTRTDTDHDSLIVIVM